MEKPSRRSIGGIVTNVARHALPLVVLYRHGSIASYLLLTAFDLSLGLLLIVSTTRDARDPTTVDERSRWFVSRVVAIVFLAIFYFVVAAIVTAPIFMPAFFLSVAAGIDWASLFSQREFWVVAGAMALFTALQGQLSFETTTAPRPAGASLHDGPVIGDIAHDRRTSLGAYAAQVTIIGTYVALCYVLIYFGRFGYVAFPILFTLLLVVFDARPDIGRRVLPSLWKDGGSRPAP